MSYTVLWIEDESEKEPNFVALCELYDIYLTIVDNAEDGVGELKRNEYKYDAVILDAKVKKNKSSAPNLEGLRTARDYILSLKGTKYIPHFIYTGQTDYQSNDIFVESFGQFYIKGEDDKNLIERIIASKKDRSFTLIRRLHQSVFRLFEDSFINPSYEKHLLKILDSIKNEESEFEDELYFNQLRQILEEAFRRAAEVGILHDKCISEKGEVKLTLSSLFLSGIEVETLNIACKKTHFPKIISNHVREILQITNIGSHAEPEGKAESEANLKEYRYIVNTPYLLYSLTFKIMDVLVWFENYISENDNIDYNKSFWVDLNNEKTMNKTYTQLGVVLFVHENGYAFFKPNEGVSEIDNSFISNSLVEEFNLNKGQLIEAEIYKSAAGKTSVKTLKKLK